MSKLFAIVHDGTFDGDSSFHCPGEEVPYKEGQSWSEVKKDIPTTKDERMGW